MNSLRPLSTGQRSQGNYQPCVFGVSIPNNRFTRSVSACLSLSTSSAYRFSCKETTFHVQTLKISKIAPRENLKKELAKLTIQIKVAIFHRFRELVVRKCTFRKPVPKSVESVTQFIQQNVFTICSKLSLQWILVKIIVISIIGNTPFINY